MSEISKTLIYELQALEGLHGQNPETGAGLKREGMPDSYLSKYTNRIFGAPYQLLDSVDRRFEDVNPHVGNEYLRNFMLNSPILHIKPGLPKYTGGSNGLGIFRGIKEIYMNTQAGMSATSALLEQLAMGTIFNRGSKLQKRLFGFRETYWDYMSHVNYMCQSMAIFLNLIGSDQDIKRGATTSNGNPIGTYTSATNFEYFKGMRWQNYRMIDGVHVTSPVEQLCAMGGATLIARATKGAANAIWNGAKWVISNIDSGAAALAAADMLNSGIDPTEALDSLQQASSEDSSTGSTDTVEDDGSVDRNLTEVIADKVQSVQFMVDPVSFEENLTNTADTSTVESLIAGVTDSVGYELAFITGSNADLGLVEGITQFLGDTVTTATEFIGGLVAPLTGGFITNLFTGAVQSIKGQKMIYPKIYKGSNSSMDYQFSINLTSPYGDVYNYYMNIVVPLMHLIALAAPRMVTSNSIASPFLVQAYIPGMCTCQLGLITNMTITKNPSTKHVSVAGFPLDLKVNFTITELYNAMTISPLSDRASFLFNETLNDYMANMAGLMPCVDTYTKQRMVMLEGVEEFLTSGEWVNDTVNSVLTNNINPFLNPTS